MLELTTQTEPAAEERIPLFSIDGKEYTIPKVVDAAFALRAMRTVRDKGELFAAAEIFEQVVGTEAYDALCNFKGLKGSQLKQLIDEVVGYVMGQVEDIAGN